MLNDQSHALLKTGLTFSGSDYFDMYVYPQKDIVSDYIVQHGNWEAKSTNNCLERMQSLRAEKGNENENGLVFIDIGGNLGWYSMVMAMHGFRVITFEPNFKNEFLIRCSMCRMFPGGSEGWLLFNNALGADSIRGQCHVDTDPNNVGNGGAVCDGSKSDKPTVEIFRLDDVLMPLFHSNEITTALIKMDVEGYEISLLRGINSSLSSKQKIAILMELHQDKYDFEFAKGIFDELLSKGFKMEFIETSSHPKPRILEPFLLESPLLISGRRALWRVKDAQEPKLFNVILDKTFVYNEFTSEYGYRVARSICFTRGITFASPRRSIQTRLWRQVYKI